MQTIKLKLKTKSRIDMAIIAINIYNHICGIKLNSTQTTVLAYFMVYGFSKKTKDLILRSKILNNPISIDNILSKLRKLGLVIKSEVGERTNRGIDIMCEGLRVDIKDSLGFIIKLENV